MESNFSSFLLINGIRTKPELMFTWTDRASRHLRLEHGIDAEKMEYYIWAIRSYPKLKALAYNLSLVVQYYNRKGIKPNIMAHSNGNVVVCIMLALHTGVQLGTWFMVMPACWESCQENGINDALKRGDVEAIRFFGSREDSVVARGGAATSWIRHTWPLNRFWRGYGKASSSGLIDIHPEVQDRIEQVDCTPWGHSTFGGDHVLDRFLDNEIVPFAKWFNLNKLSQSTQGLHSKETPKS